MPLRLVSDFNDFYDSAFSSEGTPFVRMSQDGRTPMQVLDSLKELGYRVPVYGEVRQVVDEMCYQWFQDVPRLKQGASTTARVLGTLMSVVVFDSLSPQRPRKKRLVPAWQAWESLPNQFCVEYLESPSSGVSWRYVQIGKRRWWLEFESPSDWRSTCGDYQVLLLGEDAPAYHPAFPYPLFSVDCVPGRHLYTIDFHTAPRIAGTGLENIVTPDEVVELLTEAVADLQAVRPA